MEQNTILTPEALINIIYLGIWFGYSAACTETPCCCDLISDYIGRYPWAISLGACSLSTACLPTPGEPDCTLLVDRGLSLETAKAIRGTPG